MTVLAQRIDSLAPMLISLAFVAGPPALLVFVLLALRKIARQQEMTLRLLERIAGEAAKTHP